MRYNLIMLRPTHEGHLAKRIQKREMKAPSNDNTWYTLTLSEFVNCQMQTLLVDICKYFLIEIFSEIAVCFYLSRFVIFI